MDNFTLDYDRYEEKLLLECHKCNKDFYIEWSDALTDVVAKATAHRENCK